MVLRKDTQTVCQSMSTAEFRDKSVVLREFAKYSGDWETKLRRIYRELGM